jgi:hypothetical protein
MPPAKRNSTIPFGSNVFAIDYESTEDFFIKIGYLVEFDFEKA